MFYLVLQQPKFVIRYAKAIWQWMAVAHHITFLESSSKKCLKMVLDIEILCQLISAHMMPVISGTCFVSRVLTLNAWRRTGSHSASSGMRDHMASKQIWIVLLARGWPWKNMSRVSSAMKCEVCSQNTHKTTRDRSCNCTGTFVRLPVNTWTSESLPSFMQSSAGSSCWVCFTGETWHGCTGDYAII